jgi:hypothetical protein
MNAVAPGTPTPPNAGQSEEVEVRNLLLRMLEMIAAEPAKSWRRRNDMIPPLVPEDNDECGRQR